MSRDLDDRQEAIRRAASQGSRPTPLDWKRPAPKRTRQSRLRLAWLRAVAFFTRRKA